MYWTTFYTCLLIRCVKQWITWMNCIFMIGSTKPQKSLQHLRRRRLLLNNLIKRTIITDSLRSGNPFLEHKHDSIFNGQRGCSYCAYFETIRALVTYFSTKADLISSQNRPTQPCKGVTSFNEDHFLKETVLAGQKT